MQALKINKQETPFVAVPVPVNADDFLVVKTIREHKNEAELSYWHDMAWVDVYLEWGDYKIIGCIDSLTMDEGVKVMVEEDEYRQPYGDGYVDYYRNYLRTDEHFVTDFTEYQSSVRSLLAHNGIEIKVNQKLLILKKI